MRLGKPSRTGLRSLLESVRELAPTLSLRQLGGTGLAVTPICFGTSPLASMAQLYGYAVEEQQAVATVLAAFDSPVNFLDTSNGYGEDGTAERRIGRRSAEPGDSRRTSCSPRRSTRIRVPATSQGTACAPPSRSRWSGWASTNRAAAPARPGADPFEEGVAPGGPVEALDRSPGEGLVEHLGVAGGPVGLLQQYLDTGEFEVVLSHNRYTLLDRSAEPLFDPRLTAVSACSTRPLTAAACSRRARACSEYAYGRDDRIRKAAEAMEAACRR